MSNHEDLKFNQQEDRIGKPPPLPVKSLNFQIKQLENLVQGNIKPPNFSNIIRNKKEIEKKLESLKLMHQMENINCSSVQTENQIYAYPKYFYPQNNM